MSRVIDQAYDFAAIQSLDVPEGATQEEIAAIDAEWVARIEAMEADLGARLNRLRRAAEYQKAMATMHDEEIKLLQASKKRHAKEAERIHTYTEMCVRAMGGMIEAEGWKFAIKQNPVSVLVDPDVFLAANDVPDECKRVRVEPVAKEIKAYLESFQPIPGCSLVRTESLTIKAV